MTIFFRSSGLMPGLDSTLQLLLIPVAVMVLLRIESMGWLRGAEATAFRQKSNDSVRLCENCCWNVKRGNVRQWEINVSWRDKTVLHFYNIKLWHKVLLFLEQLPFEASARSANLFLWSLCLRKRFVKAQHEGKLRRDFQISTFSGTVELKRKTSFTKSIPWHSNVRFH